MKDGIDMNAMSAQVMKAANDAPIVKCPKCGGVLWDESTIVKSVSGIYTGNKNDQIVPIPVFVCRKCGEILPQIAALDKFKELLKDSKTEEEKPSTILSV